MRETGGIIGRALFVIALFAAPLVLAAPDADAQTGDTIVTLDGFFDVGKDSSIKLDAAGNPVIAYHTSTAVKLVHCGNPTCTVGTHVEAMPWIGGSQMSLDIDAAGNPIFSYRSFQPSNDRLGIIYCSDPNCTAEQIVTKGSSTAIVGDYSSMVLDAADQPAVSYYDETNGDLKILRCDGVLCNGIAPGTTISTPDTGGDVGKYTSLALNASDNPVVAYYDDTNDNLKLLTCGNRSCNSGNVITTVDSVGTVGLSPSLALDAAGRPVISYYDLTNTDLKIVRCGNITCTAGNAIISADTAGSVGQTPSLAIDSSDRPVVSYWDITNGDLKLLHCATTSCSSRTIRSPDTGGLVGEFTSLVLDAADNPVISYYDETNGDLKVVHCDDRSCSPPQCFGLSPTIDMNANGGDGLGTAGADIIVGTTGNDTIDGEGGADRICGLDGNDIIRGDSGDDIIDGGGGVDTISGGAGDDGLLGGDGADVIKGGGGGDNIQGGAGPDDIRGQAGADSIVGGPGADNIQGGGAGDVLSGDGGHDTIDGQNGSDDIRGGAGQDLLRGQAGPDTIRGDGADDVIVGGNGADTLFGGGGTDRCSGNTGPDSAEAATCELTPGVETLF